MAGGGSLLTLPVMIFLGLPPAIANGTNRIALLVQSLVAIKGFHQHGVFPWKLGILLGIPAVIGSIIGANMAITISEDIFNKILATAMIVVLAILIWQPQKRMRRKTKEMSRRSKIIAVILFFLFGVYGGFLQAGIGFFMIAVLLLLTQLSLVEINSIKVFVIGAFSISSLIIFIIHGEVNWVYGIVLALGNGVGAALASKFAIAKGDKLVRIMLIIMVVVMAIRLFFK